jgi:dTDP-4-dehydrorhamnose 3,5-epimerase
MLFYETNLPGAYLIEIERREDERGFFARSWCQREFTKHGLNPQLVQCNVSFNHRKGTLRGMHFQAAPNAEVKIVRCTAGAIYDVMIDLRPDSPTFKQYFGAELTPENHRMLYIPEGFAHGYITLFDNTEIVYQVSQFYAPEAARGVRWDDPAFGIIWPLAVEVISERDATYPDFLVTVQPLI